MTDATQSSSRPATPAAAPDKKPPKSRVVAWLERHLATSALLTLVVGGTFGVALDKSVDALVGSVTGGPTLEKLMEEQKTNFASMQESLAALKTAAPAADLRDLPIETDPRGTLHRMAASLT